jgi:hypothetical protein
VKEERKEDVMMLDVKERVHNGPKMPSSHADLLMHAATKAGMLHPGFAGLFSNPMLQEQQQRMLSSLYSQHPATSVASLAGLPPPQPPPPMWPHLELSQHRLELQREMEREKEQLFRRFGVSAAQHEHEMLLRQQHQLSRERSAAAAAADKDASLAVHDASSKLHPPPPPLRPADIYSASSRAAPPSPLHVHGSSKSNSPASTVGAPPPLISTAASALPPSNGGSGSGSAGSSHCGSPVIKAKASPLNGLDKEPPQQSPRRPPCAERTGCHQRTCRHGAAVEVVANAETVAGSSSSISISLPTPSLPLCAMRD